MLHGQTGYCAPEKAANLQTDLIIGLLLPLRLFLAIAQKMNHKATKAQRCLFISLINLHIEDKALCGFVPLWF